MAKVGFIIEAAGEPLPLSVHFSLAMEATLFMFNVLTKRLFCRAVTSQRDMKMITQFLEMCD